MIFPDLQPIKWDSLLRAKSNNRIGSAYLFAGPKGCGKEWGAIEFAKLLNCEKPKKSPCDQCPSCSKFYGLQHPNLKIIVPLPGSDKASKESGPLDNLKKDDLEYLTLAIVKKGKDPFYKINVPNARRITINTIRDLRRTIYLKSQSYGRKVVIIFDAHLLSEGMGESANALLKILEEPPENTTLILVTDKRSALLPTIISRCQPVNFSQISFELIRTILESEGIKNDRAIQIAMVAGGDIHLARELGTKSGEDSLIEAEALAMLVANVNEAGWRKFIDSYAMMASRKPGEFKFRIYLLQLWFHYAYRVRSGEVFLASLPSLITSLEKFNLAYPNADLAGINQILEETTESLVRNFYTPLTLTNLLISIQTLLKGKEPISVI